MLPQRLARLPPRQLPGSLTVVQALSARARLLGLALLDDLPSEHALLIPRCRSVHTFGMRFALDLVFFDRAGAVVRFVAAAKPRNVFSARAAHAVLEARDAHGERFITAGAGALVADAGRTSAPAFQLTKHTR